MWWVFIFLFVLEIPSSPGRPQPGLPRREQPCVGGTWYRRNLHLYTHFLPGPRTHRQLCSPWPSIQFLLYSLLTNFSFFFKHVNKSWEVLWNVPKHLYWKYPLLTPTHTCRAFFSFSHASGALNNLEGHLVVTFIQNICEHEKYNMEICPQHF